MQSLVLPGSTIPQLRRREASIKVPRLPIHLYEVDTLISRFHHRTMGRPLLLSPRGEYRFFEGQEIVLRIRARSYYVCVFL